MNVSIIDYGAGNTKSVIYALERLGVNAIVTANPEVLENSDRIIFPGVGHATKAMESIQKNRLDQIIPALSQPVLGICLGMQLMCNSTEEGGMDGLGIFDTTVSAFKIDLNVPHTGWNTINGLDSVLFNGVSNSAHVYFVHGYYAGICKSTIATSNYGLAFSAGLQNKNFYGCQFHPEKSGEVGDLIFQNFLAL